jgi:hypothetical protein
MARILIACEESQAVCIEFRRLGHEAFSCDIQDCSGGHPEWHYKQDVFKVIELGWDMMIAHPPCTYLSLTGQWMLKENLTLNFRDGIKTGKDRQKAREDAIDFFIKLYNSPIDKVCLENPLSCMSSVFRKPDQIIQPYYFGDTEKKTTCLWLKNLPKLVYCKQDNLFETKTTVEPTMITSKTGKKYPKYMMVDASKYKTDGDRQRFRSKTFDGIAKAMAEQWSLVL